MCVVGMITQKPNHMVPNKPSELKSFKRQGTIDAE